VLDRTKSRWVARGLAVCLLGFAGCASASPSATIPESDGAPNGGSGTSSGAGGGVDNGGSGGSGGVGSGPNGASSSGGNPAAGAGSSGVPTAGTGDSGGSPAGSADAGKTSGDGSFSDAPSTAADGAPGTEGGAAVEAGPGSAASAVRFVGRVDRTNAAGPRFAWSGTTALARFTGSSIGVRMSGPTAYFDISIDGVMQPAPLVLMAGKTDYPLATNLAAGPHELTVFRRNEPGIAGTGDTTFLGLTLDPAGGALLPPSAPAARRIEIVGDSITTGYGNLSTGGACPNPLAAQNYDVAYGAVAARELNADLITIAWTAKGMYRNNAGDTTNTMPAMYGRILPDTQTTDTWDFTSWIADVVVIYLGNNDFAKGDPGQNYVTTYDAFIARVRKNYPNALIVCTIGPNISGPTLTQERTYVQGIVAAQNAAGDKNVDFLEMPQPTAAEGTGCGGHPLASTHKRMGDALAAEIKAKLGWQ
jgi:lysophospholipase L1-like esterase